MTDQQIVDFNAKIDSVIADYLADAAYNKDMSRHHKIVSSLLIQLNMNVDALSADDESKLYFEEVIYQFSVAGYRLYRYLHDIILRMVQDQITESPKDNE